MSRRKFAILAGAHSGREGLAARDVIYGIYARRERKKRLRSTA
jgi:hypothetical protein